jgi:hypothetical protein
MIYIATFGGGAWIVRVGTHAATGCETETDASGIVDKPISLDDSVSAATPEVDAMF